MKKRLNRAFTIVELVIVIAVIAILAAVLIPTFVGIVRRAEESADVQAVRNMNTALATAVEKPQNVGEAIDVMTAAGFSDAFETYSAGGSLWWNAGQNVVVFKLDGEVKFPEGYAKAEAETEYRLSFSESFDINDLSSGFAGGTGTESDPFVIASVQSFHNLRTSVENGALYNATQNINYHFSLERDLSLDNFDPVGIANVTDVENGNIVVSSFYGTYYPFSGTFDGNGHTITIERTTPNAASDSYYAGLFNLVYDATICNLNLNIDIDTTANTGSVSAGLAVFADGDVVFENITVSGQIQSGRHAAGLVAYSYTGSIYSQVSFIDCINNADLVTTYNGGSYGILGGITAQASAVTDWQEIGDAEAFNTYQWNERSLVSTTFVRCENHGSLTHQTSGAPASGTYSIIGQMVGQVAQSDGGTVYYNKNTEGVENTSQLYQTIAGKYYESPDGVITFEDCKGDGTVTGITSGADAKFEKVSESASPMKLLIGGNTSGTVIVIENGIQKTYKVARTQFEGGYSIIRTNAFPSGKDTSLSGYFTVE